MILSKKKEFHRKTNPLIKILTIIFKDIHIMMRSHISSLIFIFGPLLLILLVGISFNTSSVHDLKIGIYSESYSPLAEELIQSLNDNQYSAFKLNSQEDCISAVKLGDNQVCAILPANMEVNNDKDNTIKIYVDKSRMNIAYLVSNQISSKISSKSSKLSLDLTTNILDIVNNAKTTSSTNSEKLLQIINSLEANKQNLAKLKSDVEETDLTLDVASINTSAVDNAVDRVKNSSNVSKNTLRPITNALDDLEMDLAVVRAAMNSAKELQENSQKAISSSLNNLDSQVTSMRVAKTSTDELLASIEGISVTDASKIVSPIKTSIETVTGESTHLNNMFPTLIVIVIMFVSIIIASGMVVKEKNDKAYFRNYITPTGDSIFVLGTYLTNIILIIIQLVVICAVAAYFNPVIIPYLAHLGLVLLLITTTFISLGIFIGYLFNSEETATLGAISITSIFLFFSNTILPIEALPEYIRKVIDYSPFIISESIIKKMIMFGAPITQFLESIYILAGISVGFILLSWAIRKFKRAKFD